MNEMLAYIYTFEIQINHIKVQQSDVIQGMGSKHAIKVFHDPNDANIVKNIMKPDTKYGMTLTNSWRNPIRLRSPENVSLSSLKGGTLTNYL